jgi:hypothetical protein
MSHRQCFLLSLLRSTGPERTGPSCCFLDAAQSLPIVTEGTNIVKPAHQSF